MGKFGNEFQSNQIQEWRDKYINYISLKQKINNYIKDIASKNINELSEIEKSDIMLKYKNEFIEELNKETRKIYVLYSKEEKHLYKIINKYLHIKDEFDNYTLDDFLTQFSELKDLSVTSYKIAKFVYYNLKSLIKILEKYDKKITGSKDKENQLKNEYIISKLEDQNSDILYLINFKMIDEVNVIVEDLIKTLKDNFKKNKSKYKNSIINLSSGSKNENLLEKTSLNLDDTSLIIDVFHQEIKNNLKKIDTLSNDIIMLFKPWKNFLRISGDISSKLVQLIRESNNFIDSIGSNDSINKAFKNNKSLVDTISFSKENLYNIYITLFHGFIYMFSFSSVIPFYPGLISSKDFWKNNYEENITLFCGLLMMMTSLGSIISYLYESCWFKMSTKAPLIVSCCGLLVGNFIYYVSNNIHLFAFIFIGRFLIGLFNLRTHNKMYLMNFLLKKDVNFYLTLFHVFSMFGLSFGFLLNIINIYIFKDNKKEVINKYIFGPLLSTICVLILLILSLIFYTEARSINFNMTSMKSFSAIDSSNLIRESNVNSITNKEIDDNNNIHSNNKISEEKIDEEYTKEVRKKSIMVNDINDKLGDFNRKSNFNDTNLVSLSVNELTYKEKERLNYLFKSFIVYLSIVFTTKFINEGIFINFPFFMINNKDEWICPTLLGCSCLISLVIEFCLRHKNKWITEKMLLIILFILNLINNFILAFIYENKNLFYFILLGLSLIFSIIIEKYATHFFNYIIPQNYIICKIQGNIFINIFSVLSKIIASLLLIFFGKNNRYEMIIFILNIIFSFICTLLFLIFYSDIRIKSISRILTKQGKDEIKIATDI